MGTSWSPQLGQPHQPGHRCSRSAKMHLPTPKERLSLTCADSAGAVSFSVPLGSDGDALLEPMEGEGGAELFPGGKKNTWTNPFASVQGKKQLPSFLRGFFPLGTQEKAQPALAHQSSALLDLVHLPGSRSAARITREEPGSGNSSGLPMPSCGSTPRVGMRQRQGLGAASLCFLHWSQYRDWGRTGRPGSLHGGPPRTKAWSLGLPLGTSIHCH